MTQAASTGFSHGSFVFDEYYNRSYSSIVDKDEGSWTENKLDALSLQILEGVEARGLIWYSPTPLGYGSVLQNPL
jgi:hypothetical protein